MATPLMTFEFSFLLSAGRRNVIGSAARRLLHPRSAKANSVSRNSRTISCFDSLQMGSQNARQRQLAQGTLRLLLL
jgi:hypothetical protein